MYMEHVWNFFQATKIRGNPRMRGVPPQMLELVAGLGEVWSAQTLAVSRFFVSLGGLKRSGYPKNS